MSTNLWLSHDFSVKLIYHFCCSSITQKGFYTFMNSMRTCDYVVKDPPLSYVMLKYFCQSVLTDHKGRLWHQRNLCWGVQLWEFTSVIYCILYIGKVCVTCLEKLVLQQKYFHIFGYDSDLFCRMLSFVLATTYSFDHQHDVTKFKCSHKVKQQIKVVATNSN